MSAQAVVRWRKFRNGEVHLAVVGKGKGRRFGYVIYLPARRVWWAMTLRESLGDFEALSIARTTVEEAFHAKAEKGEGA